jgi:hypothetical protein
MDSFTHRHFNAWCDNQFGDDLSPVTKARMVETFGGDAEFWGLRGYWALYDFVIAQHQTA